MSPPAEINYSPVLRLANVDSVDITIKGRGGHRPQPRINNRPHRHRRKAVLDLQTIVIREVKPIDPAVVTVGSIHAVQSTHHLR